MRPRDPDDDQIRDEEAIDERKQLNKLRLSSFTATPGTVKPFEPSTLAWAVVVPESVSKVLNVTFTIGSHSVAAKGSLAVLPLATGAFVLTAHSGLTSRLMGTKVVNVDLSEIVEAGIPRAAIQFSAQPVKDLFKKGSLSSGGDLSVQMLPPDGLRLKVPLKAAIPHFYNADIDVSLDIRVSVKVQPAGQRVASATLSDASTNVIFHVAEHIFSAGTATAAQGLIQPLAADLIKGFLGPQVEAIFAEPLQRVIVANLDLWRGNDPARRVYRLYSITADPSGLVIHAAPVPPGGGGGLGPIIDDTDGTVVINRNRKATKRRRK